MLAGFAVLVYGEIEAPHNGQSLDENVRLPTGLVPIIPVQSARKGFTIMSMISVGMPVLNGASCMARAIRDLQNQTFADFELVICDNHSDDDTVAIARALAKEDPRIRVIAFDKRVDILHSFQRALDNTTAPFFMFAPADDRWYPTFMEDTLSALQDNPQAIACTGRVAFHRNGRFSHISKGTAALTGSP